MHALAVYVINPDTTGKYPMMYIYKNSELRLSGMDWTLEEFNSYFLTLITRAFK
jgi:hypothetical protein